MNIIVEDCEIVDEKRQSVKGEEKRLSCHKCSRNLGYLFITNTPYVNRDIKGRQTVQLPLRYKVLCPCGGFAFIVKTNNKAFYNPESVLVTDMDLQSDGLYTIRTTNE